MKVVITLKDPDGVGDSIREAVHDSLDNLELSPQETEAVFELREEEISDAVRPWIECSEYVTIEIDTDKGTARVVPVSENE